MHSPPLAPSLLDMPADVLWIQHCAEGPVPRAAAQAIRNFVDMECRPQDLSVEEWLALPNRVRQAAARLFNTRAEDVSFTGSTSGALTVVAQTFPFEPGDEVVLPLGEYPANVWPWKALAGRGVNVREVPLWPGHASGTRAWEGVPPTSNVDPEARLLDALGRHTRILAVSWVRFQDGLTLDLQRLARACEERDVALVVDGIQGAGTLPLNLQGVEAFATGVHKGLLSAQGVGLLATDPAFRAQLHPMGSWLSVQEGSNWGRPSTDLAREWLPDGRKLEQGAPGGVLLSGLEVSLNLLHDITPQAIATHVAALQRLLLQHLSTSPTWRTEAERLTGLLAAGRLGSILSLHHGGKGPAFLMDLHRRGMEQKVYASVREGYLRVALHGWHTPADVQRIAAWLNGK